MKKSIRVVNSSSRFNNGHNGGSGRHHISPGHTGSLTQRRSTLVGDSSRRQNQERRDGRASRRAAQVLDDDGKDVTPLPLYHSEPGDTQCKPCWVLDESVSSVGSLQPPSLSTTVSWTRESGNSFPTLDISINSPAPCEVLRKRDNAKQHVTEEMLDEKLDVFLSETETISLLDIPPVFMSEDADDAEDIKERNIQYAALCKRRAGSDKYVGRSAQTLKGGPLNKQTQTDETVTVDEGTSASIWDTCDQSETPESEKTGCPESTEDISKGETSSSEMETCWSGVNAESNLQLIMLSESFQRSLFVMEKSLAADILQPKLAAYRQLPALGDPNSAVKPGAEELTEEGEESSSYPTLEHLWAFSCELTKGLNITSMVWNKENQDLLAVGYGDYKNHTPSLICCWCLRNPTQPELVFHCHSCVTSLDFSANKPDQLAAGMYDGTVAVYNVRSQDNPCIDSSQCSTRHLHPVWRVNWTKTTLSGGGGEALVSASEDGRISKWFFCMEGLDCKDLMVLRKTDGVTPFTPATPARCLDFHPTDSSIYLVGTRDGPIHKCSVSLNEYLDTYQKHFYNVNHIEWSPFSPDVFLSCSSDGTIQLWKQDRFTPVWSFTSTETDVRGVRWSPLWSTVFAAINGQQVDIWDLKSSFLHPTIVHHAAAGVEVTSLLFARGTDCLLVGDSVGQVTVYQLKNLKVGEGKQVDSLDDIIRSLI